MISRNDSPNSYPQWGLGSDIDLYYEHVAYFVITKKCRTLQLELRHLIIAIFFFIAIISMYNRHLHYEVNPDRIEV